MALTRNERNARRRERYKIRKDASKFNDIAFKALEGMKNDGTDRSAGKNSSGTITSLDSRRSANGMAQLRTSHITHADIRAIKRASSGARVSSRLDRAKPPWQVLADSPVIGTNFNVVHFLDGKTWNYSSVVYAAWVGTRDDFMKEVWLDANGRNPPLVTANSRLISPLSPNAVTRPLAYLPTKQQYPHHAQDDAIRAMKRVHIKAAPKGKGLWFYPVSTATDVRTPIELTRAICKRRSYENKNQGPHLCPSIGCECGWHATKLSHLDTNSGIGQKYSGYAAYETPRLEVELFGIIIECTEGYRAEYQRPLLLDFTERPLRNAERPKNIKLPETCRKCAFKIVTANCWPLMDSDVLMASPSFSSYDFGAFTYNVVTHSGEVLVGMQLDFDRNKKPADVTAYRIKGRYCNHPRIEPVPGFPAEDATWLLDNLKPADIARQVGLPIKWSDGKVYK